MFSWSKKKDTKKRGGKKERSSEENEFGIKLDQGPSDKQLEAELRKLAGVSDLPEDEFQMNDEEEDVESELLRLMGKKGKKTPKKEITSDEAPQIDIMADITAEVDLGDEDVDVDENDPDLLGELLELTQGEDGGIEDELESESEPEDDIKPSNGETDILKTLKERLKMYQAAEEKAKLKNETSRARRFNRGIKTLQDLIKKAKAGKAVSETEIPPEIAMNLKPAPPPPPQLPHSEANGDEENGLGNDVQESEGFDEPPQSINSQNSDAPQEPENVLEILMERLKMYQIAESKAKEGGETTRARRFNRGIKTIEGLLRQCKAGKPVLPAEIPPKVALNLKPPPPEPVKQPDENFENLEDEGNENELENLPAEEEEEKEEEEEEEEEERKEIKEPERNVMEVLSERLDMYKAAEAKAKEMGETTRARRFLRGIKTIQDLIKQVNAGNTVSIQDIPPAVALNLKPAPPPLPQPVVAMEEEENDFRENVVERDELRQAFNNLPAPIKFAPANDDDIDLDDELLELEVPTTVMEGLEQRVKIYKKLKMKAQAEGDDAAAKQCDEVINLYLKAIRTFKSGGYVDVLKLPAPKGAPPIPIPFHFS